MELEDITEVSANPSSLISEHVLMLVYMNIPDANSYAIRHKIGGGFPVKSKNIKDITQSFHVLCNCPTKNSSKFMCLFYITWNDVFFSKKLLFVVEMSLSTPPPPFYWGNFSFLVYPYPFLSHRSHSGDLLLCVGVRRRASSIVLLLLKYYWANLNQIWYNVPSVG